jgi:hypothetical protein
MATIIKQSAKGCASIGGSFNRGFQLERPWAMSSGHVHNESLEAIMKKVWGITLLVGTGIGLLLGPQHTFAQACKDEVTMVEGSRQALVELTGTVKAEGLKPFETLNHQKSAVNKLALHDSMLGELVSCLDKASQDKASSKEDAATAKALYDASVKIQTKIKHQQSAVK